MRANESRARPLYLVTLRVCSLGLCATGLLRSLCGSFISILSVRTRLLSAMNFIFDATSASDDDTWILRLSPALKDELYVLITLATLSVVNLRATLSCAFRATDASDWGMAAVAADLDKNIVREAMRLSVTRGAWTKLLPPGKAWLRSKAELDPSLELPDGEVFDVHPFWEALARVPSYRELWRRPHLRPVHINIGESRAYLLEELRVSSSTRSSRFGFGLDSQVLLGAPAKGRSSSKPINAELVKSIPPLLGADLYPFRGYFPSKLNRADGPTRSSPPDPPDMEEPWWWNDVCGGCFAAQ